MTDSVSARKLTPNDYITDGIAGLLGYLPGYRGDTRGAYQKARDFTGLLDWTPLGTPEMLHQAGGLLATGARDKSLGGLLGGAGMAALGAFPAARKALPLIKETAKGIRAYHGSPYAFDKFDISKIGTGEGAQSYGHGLYFAENESVAKQYRDAFSDPENVPLQYRGKPVDSVWNGDVEEKWADVLKSLPPSERDGFVTVMSNLGQINRLEDVKNVLGSLSPQERAIYQKHVAPSLVKPPTPAAHMYEVNINADPAQFLDWDKPLSAQPEARLAYEDFLKSDAGREADWSMSGAISRKQGQYADPTGKDFYGAVYESMPGIGMAQRAKITETLQGAGIPGIKYLDQGSRGAGEGSRNYVVFNPSLVDIMRRYAMPAAVGVGGVGMLPGLLPQSNQPSREY